MLIIVVRDDALGCGSGEAGGNLRRWSSGNMRHFIPESVEIVD